MAVTSTMLLAVGVNVLHWTSSRCWQINGICVNYSEPNLHNKTFECHLHRQSEWGSDIWLPPSNHHLWKFMNQFQLTDSSFGMMQSNYCCDSLRASDLLSLCFSLSIGVWFLILWWSLQCWTFKGVSLIDPMSSNCVWSMPAMCLLATVWLAR